MYHPFLPAGCARSARPAGTEIYIFVCVRPQLSRLLSYVIRYYATIATSAVEAGLRAQ